VNKKCSVVRVLCTNFYVLTSYNKGHINTQEGSRIWTGDILKECFLMRNKILIIKRMCITYRK